ncbi:MAG TPA: helix-turn-helix domain-containing protein [Pyrinomonadaceae bacterium]|nr:helix-turn-helix domain-containing protein [Pyrinomonadaceae bacterium]
MINMLEKMAQPKRVSLQEMARLLNRCEKTFRKYVIQYQIPHIRLGRDMLFDPSEVENYLTEMTMKNLELENNTISKDEKSKGKKTKINLNKPNTRYAKLLGLS